MSDKIRVQDWSGEEITVGTKGQYGEPNPKDPSDRIERYRCTVTAISEPEVTFHEDEHGHDVADGEEVILTLHFVDGDECDTKARLTYSHDWGEVFEEGGDFEVKPWGEGSENA